jgi:ferric-dicitrate binding protein FerR (iron transport regulator)
MKSEIDWPLVLRYLSDACSPAERQRVLEWMDGAPERKEYVESLRHIADARAAGSASFDPATSWGAMHARLGLGPSTAQPQASGRDWANSAPGIRRIGAPIDSPRPTYLAALSAAPSARRMGWAVAAGLVIALGWSVATRSPASQQFREFTTAAGNRATVTLHDGTQLMLGPATRVRVPLDFGRSERIVELDGEALFAVVHDTRHPFAVRTERTTVRDVGTTFVVAAYAGDPSERVAVSEGEVMLGGTELRARDRASIDASGHMSVTRGTDVSPDLAWSQGRLVFEDTPLREAARTLARALDLEIVLADSTLGSRRLTAAFGDDPADEVLDAISQAVGAQYERTGRKVILRRRVGAADRGVPASRAPLVTTQSTPSK